jgi:hypothetical protein
MPEAAEHLDKARQLVNRARIILAAGVAEDAGRDADYNMNLLATIFCLGFFLLSSTSYAACGSDPVPAPAAAHGFTYEIFCDDFTSLSTIDLSNTGATNFKWHIQNPYREVLNPADYTIVADGLQINPSTNTAHDYWNLESCFYVSHGVYTGNTVQGGMYVDIKISSIAPDPGGDFWWPALWMLGVFQFSNSTPPLTSPEVDLLEHFSGGRNLHSWFIFSGGQTDTFVGYATTPTFTNGNVYGVLILKPGQNGGTGTLVGYLNDIEEAMSFPVTWAPGATYGVTSEVPMCILMTTGYNQPMVVRSVQVFTTPPSPGSGRPRRGLR